MKTTDYIRMTLETSKRLTLGLIDDMKDAPLTEPTANGGNHPLWILGHLVCSEANIISHMLQGNENPLAQWQDLFGRGSKPVQDASIYPSIDELMLKFEEVRAHTLSVLDGMTDDDLDQPSKNIPPGRENVFGTVGQCFLMASIHPLMHYGQVADARRSLGRQPAFA